MSARPDTPLLDRVNKPEDLKHLSDAELARLADELRAETISAVSETGGHLGAGLGVVELTVALHAEKNYSVVVQKLRSSYKNIEDNKAKKSIIYIDNKTPKQYSYIEYLANKKKWLKEVIPK